MKYNDYTKEALIDEIIRLEKLNHKLESSENRNLSSQTYYSSMKADEMNGKAVYRVRDESQKEQIHLKKYLEEAKLLQAISIEFLGGNNINTLYERIMDTAMKIMHSDFASMQMLCNNSDGHNKLRLLAYHGFNSNAAKLWEWIDAESSSSVCGEALRTGKRVIVPEVEECNFMLGTKDLECLLQNGIYAVQTTPLYSRSGRMLGMISTHWNKPYQPTEYELSMFDVVARQAADLIERKIAEEMLRESEEKYRTLFESIDEGYCIVEVVFDDKKRPVDYRFIEVNPAFEEQTGLKDAVGKLMRSLAPEHEEYWFEIYGQVATDGKSVRFVNEAKALNRWYNVYAFRLGCEGSRRVAILFNDITKEIKNKLEMERLLKMQEEFFINISHELKTPLNVIFSTNQLLEMYSKNNLFMDNKDKIDKSIKHIRQNCLRMTRLINNVIDLSKIDAGFLSFNQSNEDIVNIIGDIVRSVSDYTRRREISIAFESDIDEKVIACDPEKIEKIMLNLISNSIKFTNRKGSILVKLMDKGNYIEIIVTDTGMGIDGKYLDKIFERFQQADKSLSRNAEGTGIGLSLVKTFVDMHGGKISVESEMGKGSMFKIELPITTVKYVRNSRKNVSANDRIEKINIEFSDIYTL